MHALGHPMSEVSTDAVHDHFEALLTTPALPCMHRHGEAPAVADLMIAVVNSSHVEDARDLVAVLIARK